MGKFSHQQQVALAIAPKISTFLSIIGSAWISTEVLRDPRKRAKLYHRLMLTMSFGDVFRSGAQFLTTWPMPSDTPGVAFAAGNTATCAAQGFVFQAGLPFILYHGYLAIFYVLVLTLNWPDRRIEPLERFALGFTVILSLGTSVAGLPLRLYNAANLWCWIAPLDCAESENKDCVRGENSWIYRYAFWYAWLWTTFAVNTVCLLLIFCTVRMEERRIGRRQGRQSGIGRKARHCRQVVAGQGIYYTITFTLQMSFNTATRVIQQRTGKTYFPLVLLMAFFAPLNGFWNGLIYLRPRFLSLKNKHSNWSTRRIIREVLSRIRQQENDIDDDDHELGILSSSDQRELSNTGGQDDFHLSASSVSYENEVEAQVEVTIHPIAQNDNDHKQQLSVLPKSQKETDAPHCRS